VCHEFGAVYGCVFYALPFEWGFNATIPGLSNFGNLIFASVFLLLPSLSMSVRWWPCVTQTS